MNANRVTCITAWAIVVLLLPGTARRAAGELIFGTPTNLGSGVNSGHADASANISADGLALFFVSARSPADHTHADIFVATRATVDESFAQPQRLGPLINTSAHEGEVDLSPDGLSLFFTDGWYNGATTPRPGGAGAADIWVATRGTTTDDFASVENLGAPVNSQFYDGGPNISADQLSLFFSSSRPNGSGQADLWMVTRADAVSAWGGPANLGPNVNSSAHDTDPIISPDGLSLIFTSFRSPTTNSGLWMSSRATTSDPWSEAIPLPPLVNSARTGLSAMSPDGKTLFIASDRPGGFGSFDLYSIPVESTIVSSITDGNWEAPGTWDGDTPTPSAEYDSVVRSHMVTVTGNAFARRLIVESGTLAIPSDGSLAVAQGVRVAAEGALDVAGTLSAASLTTAGVNTVSAGAIILVDDELTLDSVFELSDATLSTTAGVTNIKVNAGGALSVGHPLAGARLDVAGIVQAPGAAVTLLNMEDGGRLDSSGTVVATSVNLTGGTLRLYDGANMDADTVEVSSGILSTAADVTADHLNVTAGTVQLSDGADLKVGAMQVAGGTVNTGTGHVVVGESLKIGAKTLSITEGTFRASSLDLADSAEADNLTLTGGTLAISRYVDTPGTILVVSDQSPGGRDDSLVGLLESSGYTVDTSGMAAAYRQDQAPFDDPVKAAALGDADLVLVSRYASSTKYYKDQQNWNGLETPLVLMSGYLARDGKWGWTNGRAGNAAKTESEMVVEAGQENHPFVAGLTSPVQVFDWTEAPNHEAPNAVYLPHVNTVRDAGQLVGTFDRRPYLLDIPAGFDLDQSVSLEYGTTGARRAFLGQWGYDADEYGFDSFITADFEALFATVLDEMVPPRPGPLAMGNTHLTVGDDSVLRLDTHEAAILGDLALHNGTALTILDAPVTEFGNVTAADGSSIEGVILIRGVLSPGDRIGNLEIDGDLTMEEAALFACELDETGSDVLAVTGRVDLNTGSRLALQAVDSLATVGETTRTIVTAAAVNGVFTVEPALGEHLGHGVFHRDMAYTNDAATIDVSVFQAAAGDTNGDRQVNNADLQEILGAGSFGAGHGWGWRQGDFNGDEVVNNADLQLILATGLFGTGLYGAAAPETGVLVVPEPGTLLLLASGVFGLLLARRRR